MVSLIIVCLVLSCTARPFSRARLADVEPFVLDAFVARGFIGGSDYERYHLEEDVLWRECGHVAERSGSENNEQTLEGDHIFSQDPALEVNQRRVEAIKEETLIKLAQLAQKVFEQSENSLPSPGSVYSLSGPGLFELNAQLGPTKKSLITSVDAVADKDSPLSRSLRDLFSGLRSVGPIICNTRSFYGIKRTNL